jgi:hypothetical protein
MSTRSHIGIQNDDLTITSIYCHFDGYPSRVGLDLFNYYQDKEKVKKLLSFGMIRSVEEDIKKVFAYHKDGGEEFWQAQHKSIKDYENFQKEDIGIEYIYLYINNRWITYDLENEEWVKLTKEYCNEN